MFIRWHALEAAVENRLAQLRDALSNFGPNSQQLLSCTYVIQCVVYLLCMCIYEKLIYCYTWRYLMCSIYMYLHIHVTYQMITFCQGIVCHVRLSPIHTCFIYVWIKVCIETCVIYVWIKVNIGWILVSMCLQARESFHILASVKHPWKRDFAANKVPNVYQVGSLIFLNFSIHELSVEERPWCQQSALLLYQMGSLIFLYFSIREVSVGGRHCCLQSALLYQVGSVIFLYFSFCQASVGERRWCQQSALLYQVSSLIFYILASVKLPWERDVAANKVPYYIKSVFHSFCI